MMMTVDCSFFVFLALSSPVCYILNKNSVGICIIPILPSYSSSWWQKKYNNDKDVTIAVHFFLAAAAATAADDDVVREEDPENEIEEQTRTWLQWYFW